MLGYIIHLDTRDYMLASSVLYGVYLHTLNACIRLFLKISDQIINVLLQLASALTVLFKGHGDG